MDKKNLDAILSALKSAGIKTASALRELLSESETISNDSAETLSARGRINALFDEGTFMESGTYVRRRNGEFDAEADDSFEGVICGWGSVNGRLTYVFSQD